MAVKASAQRWTPIARLRRDWWLWDGFIESWFACRRHLVTFYVRFWNAQTARSERCQWKCIVRKLLWFRRSSFFAYIGRLKVFDDLWICTDECFRHARLWVNECLRENRKENTNSRTRRTKRRAEKRSRWQMQVFLVKVTRCRVFSEIGNYLFVRATSMTQMFMDLCHFVVLTGGANFPSLLFHSSMLPLQCHQG